jgi:16S rRNA processing protein RimM
MIYLIEAGHSYKVHGVKGELFVSFEPRFKKQILKSGVVFIRIEGNNVPFFIESVRGDEELIIKFKEVDNPETARELSNKPIYIDDHGMQVSNKSPDTVEEDESTLLHFQIEDIASGFTGRIKSIEEFPGQLMALIENDTKEFMMPIHEDWIVEIDQVNKRMRVNLPEGLLEL